MRLFLSATVLGALVALFVFATQPAFDSPRIEPVQEIGADGSTHESFFFKAPEDGIAVTHSGRVPLAMGPPGVGALSEPAIDKGFALILNLRNARDEIIGFGVELEVHPEGDMLAQDLRWDTDWLLVIPGRGMLVLHQQEHSGELGPKVINTIRRTGEDWVGDWTVQTTVGPAAGGRGVVIGGTGEFAGAEGSFVEIDHLTRFTADGAMHGDFELRLVREAGR